MLPLKLTDWPGSGNNILRFCFILILAMSAFAASPSQSTIPAGHITTVVRPDSRTGHLIRRSAFQSPAFNASAFKIKTLPMAAVAAPAQQQASTISQLIDNIAAEQGVERHLVHSVIRAESNYNPNAISPKGAVGIMQLIPSTARRFGVADAFDAGDNIRGGVRYLKFLLDYYQGDYVKTIAAYNAGEGAVDKYNGIPPYAETQTYVYRVARNLESARKSEATPVLDVEPSTESVKIETTRPIETSTGSDGRVYYRTP